MSRAMIIGVGSSLPQRVVTNDDLAQMVDTSDEWIRTRTGIRTRRIAGKAENTSILAAKAARKALKMAGLTAADLDMIIVATITADMIMPSCACLVQKEIGAENACAFDINAACSGFLYALSIADKYIQGNADLKVLVIGAETLSTRTNWQDRNTCVLFGDGAGAALLTGGPDALFSDHLFADGRLNHLLYAEAAQSMNPALEKSDYDGSYIKMSGRDVFKHAVRSMERAIAKVLASEGVALDQLDLVIPHQANIRILNNLGEKLGLDPEKLYIKVDKYGNTSAASIPTALADAVAEGRLQSGDYLLLCAFGGGFTWGATLLRWP
ncbi:MAG: beta-ketoacyl-ACP synthase III [Thermodesulfobacteriota bacterium]